MVKQIKNLNDLKKQLNLTDEEIENAIHWGNLIEHHFFNDERTGSDYRHRAIDFCIRNRIDFAVTQNNPYEMLTRFIRMICPKCHRVMKVKSSGGDSHTHNIGCRCATCGLEGQITIPIPDGMSFHFKK